MSNHEVLFGLGDLADRLAALVGETAPELDQDAPPSGQKPVYVHVGQMYSSAQPALVSTILGSCVAVCLWDPATGMGGLNHYLLPHRVENGISSPRFGNVAIERLITDLAGMGADPRRLKAKVFGGASVIEAFQSNERSLGMANVELARQLLRGAGIPIVAEDVGGTQGRKVMFQTTDGAAWVRRI